jgi:hypothetical protein
MGSPTRAFLVAYRTCLAVGPSARRGAKVNWIPIGENRLEIVGNSRDIAEVINEARAVSDLAARNWEVLLWRWRHWLERASRTPRSSRR